MHRQTALDRRLSKTVAGTGRQVNRVNKVLASVKPGTRVVYIWEADEEDTDGILVHRSGSTASINLAEVLIPLHLPIESGHYETYALEFSEPTDAEGHRFRKGRTQAQAEEGPGPRTRAAGNACPGDPGRGRR